MRWFKPNLKNYFLALMGTGEATHSTLQNHTESIRQFILDELGESGETTHPKIILRIRYAQDVQALWYARGDIMTVLASTYGETIARERVGRITDKFKGLLPRGLSSRPSSLTN